MLHQAGDADIWLIRYSQGNELTLEQLTVSNPLYAQFKAYHEGNVYGCNTVDVRLYDEMAFHPQWYLAELIRIFRGEGARGISLKLKIKNDETGLGGGSHRDIVCA